MKKLLRAGMLLITLPITPAPAPTTTHDVFQHFWNVAETLHKVQTRSFRQVPTNELIEAGLKAMVNKVDAHSSFFTPQSYQSTIDMASGQFPGIGVSIIQKAVDEDSLLIVDVVRGGPAERSGIQSGDKIVEVNGTKLRGLTSDEVVTKLKGKIDTTVTIKITRDKKPLDFVVTRKIIKDRNVTSYWLSQHCVAYLKIATFTEKTPQLVSLLLRKAHTKKARSIILDLRKNPGGLLDAAVKTSSLFIPKKSLVATTQNNRREVITSYHTSSEPIHDLSVPVFIVTDNFTASSSEVLTGCLQYYAHQNKGLRVFVVGTTTFGKASVQEITPLSYGCALKLTTMLYYLPGNTCLQAVGITPDIIAKPKTVPEYELRWVEELYGKEASLPNHITRDEVEGRPRNTTPVKKEHHVQTKRAHMSPAEIEASLQKSIAQDHLVHTCLTLSNVYHLAVTHMPEKVATHADAVAYLKAHVVTDEQPVIESLE